MKPIRSIWVQGLLAVTLISTCATAMAGSASGPLKVSKNNPRYFMDGKGRIVFLTGSHTWANLQDQGAKFPAAVFDYKRYLEFMGYYNHNFMRMWAWEQSRWAPWADGKGPNPSDWFIQPNPYLRSGPGLAADGEPKFDLSRFDEAYFNRLRDRVQKAGKRGIYVSIMLFQGWSSAREGLGGTPWRGHPYNPNNNIQGYNGNSSGDSGPDLNDPSVREFQSAYIHKVIDTVNDLDNVLYEVCNEGGNKAWDWWVVNLVHDCEKTKPKQHPVGLTGHGSESNNEMLSSPADWISPGSNDWPDLKTDPRLADGTKVSLLDTDHVFGVGGDQQWVWKAFMGGHNVLFMDPYDDPQWTGILEGQHVGTPHADDVRRAMGIVRRVAVRIHLETMVPNPRLATTGFCLAQPGVEYLVYQPKGGQGFSVELPSGKYRCEWFDASTGLRLRGDTVVIRARPMQEFRAPFDGDAVLHLTKKGK